MGFLERLFGNKKVQQNTNQKSPIPAQDNPKNENALRVIECGDFINSILAADRYIARSEYSQKISAFSSDIEFFSVLKKSGMFEDFCKKNVLMPSRISNIMESYENIQKLIDDHNDKYNEIASAPIIG